MARIFLDTSVLVKLYVPEPDSAAIMALIHADDELLICDLTPLEYRSALYRKVRANQIDAGDADLAIQAFQAHPEFYNQQMIGSNAFQSASDLLDRFAVSHGLRPPDALQLATALEAHSHNPIDHFLTTDNLLADVARASGFNVLP